VAAEDSHRDSKHMTSIEPHKQQLLIHLYHTTIRLDGTVVDSTPQDYTQSRFDIADITT